MNLAKQASQIKLKSYIHIYIYNLFLLLLGNTRIENLRN